MSRNLKNIQGGKIRLANKRFVFLKYLKTKVEAVAKHKLLNQMMGHLIKKEMKRLIKIIFKGILKTRMQYQDFNKIKM